MTSLPPDPSQPIEPQLERAFIEQERNRFAGRALSLLVLLNGVAALILLMILARAPESTANPKIAAAMMFFSGGAVAALLSSFLAYVNRTVRMESPSRANLRLILRALAIASVIGSGAAFLTGMNMVGATSAEKSSSHPKGQRQERSPTSAPSDRVEHLNLDV
ncbi:MAG TPA: hypothetical protein VFD26_08800 [Methyloceanibacter sp.]|nr:hypothetical protein [Methyloceanibacter sp.]